MLYTSLRNAHDDDEAYQIARRLLDFTAERWTPSQRPLTKLTGFTGGPSWVDSVIVLVPAVAQVIVGQAYFLVPRTHACYLSNNAEATGDETQAEATVRESDAGFNDLTRRVAPVIFCRFRLEDGNRSAKHLAIAKAAEVTNLIERADIAGGVIELESFEHEPCTMTFAGKMGGCDMRLDGKERNVSATEATAIFDVFSREGMAAISG